MTIPDQWIQMAMMETTVVWITLGPMDPDNYAAEAVSLIQALDRSRGKWRFKGQLADDGKVSPIDAESEIVGGSPRDEWSFNAPIRYRDDPWFSATLLLGKPVKSPDEVSYVLAIHLHFSDVFGQRLGGHYTLFGITVRLAQIDRDFKSFWMCGPACRFGNLVA